MASTKEVIETAGLHGDSASIVGGNAASVESPMKAEIDAEAHLPAKTEQESREPDPPPNGGTVAWLQVLGSFFLFFNCWYVLLCYSNSSNMDGTAKSRVLGGQSILLEFSRHTTRITHTGLKLLPTYHGLAQYKHSCCSWSAL